MKARVLMIALAAGLTAWGSSASALCPFTRSAPEDAPFDYDRDVKDCVFNMGPEGSPGSRAPVHYLVTCPGRMTKADAEKVGGRLTNGSLKLRTSPQFWNSIRDADVFREYNVKPMFVGIPYLAHHRNCTMGSRRRPVVCTDFKVTVEMQIVGGAEIAPSCKDVNQSGSIAWGQRMDREYKCAIHFRSNEPGLAQETARWLLRRDYQEEARRKGYRVCLLAETSFQCAPCSTTDKLVVRVYTTNTGRHALCPPGTYDWVE